MARVTCRISGSGVTVSLDPTEDASIDKILASPNGVATSDRQAAVDRALASSMRSRFGRPRTRRRTAGVWQPDAGGRGVANGDHRHGRGISPTRAGDIDLGTGSGIGGRARRGRRRRGARQGRWRNGIRPRSSRTRSRTWTTWRRGAWGDDRRPGGGAAGGGHGDRAELQRSWECAHDPATLTLSSSARRLPTQRTSCRRHPAGCRPSRRSVAGDRRHEEHHHHRRCLNHDRHQRAYHGMVGRHDDRRVDADQVGRRRADAVGGQYANANPVGRLGDA